MLTKKTIVFMVLVAVVVIISPAGAQEEERVRVTLTYQPTEPVESVHAAGEFNEWEEGVTELTDEQGNGIYDVTLELLPGEYEYKYVINGDEWIEPPNADAYTPDDFAGQNAVLQVRGEFEGGTPGDGNISLDELKHEMNNNRYLNPLADDKVEIRFQTERDGVEQIILHYYDGEARSVELDQFFKYNIFEYYQTEIEIDSSQFQYYFEVVDGENRVWYGAEGIEEDRVGTLRSAADSMFGWLRTFDDGESVYFDQFEFNLAEADIFKTPDWVEDAVFYQIFPDRFNKGTDENNPDKIKLYQDETTRYDAYIPEWDQGIKEGENRRIRGEEDLLDSDNPINREAGRYTWYGGDLQGVEEKIPYLKELGINAVYFNPIIKSSTNYRYNAADFRKIDDTLAIKGDQEASMEYFEELVEKLDKAGIRVILDVAFNHVGYEHWAFQDVIEHGEDSDYVDWFNIEDFPVVTLYEQQQEGKEANYDAWWDTGIMPELNLDNPEVREYVFEATEKWMETGIDGWRLDTPTYVTETDPEFWADWREHVKNINPEAYLVSEVWSDATEYLQGDEFDAVMNYRLRDILVRFLGEGRIDADEFHSDLMKLQFDYPQQSNYAMQNLISCHDTTRYLSLIGEDKDRLKLTALFQMTYSGAPMVYYGDEVGMKGVGDPDNRRTMIWEDRGYVSPDEQLREYYKEIIELRNQEPALRRGDIERVELESDMVYGLLREYEGEKLLVLLNAGEEQTTVKPELNLTQETYQDILNNEEITADETGLNIELAPVSGRVIKLK